MPNMFGELAKSLIETSKPVGFQDEQKKVQQSTGEALKGFEVAAGPRIKSDIQAALAPDAARRGLAVKEDIGREFAPTAERISHLMKFGSEDEKGLAGEYNKLFQQQAAGQTVDPDRFKILQQRLQDPRFARGLTDLRKLRDFDAKKKPVAPPKPFDATKSPQYKLKFQAVREYINKISNLAVSKLTDADESFKQHHASFMADLFLRSDPRAIIQGNILSVDNSILTDLSEMARDPEGTMNKIFAREKNAVNRQITEINLLPTQPEKILAAIELWTRYTRFKGTDPVDTVNGMLGDAILRNAIESGGLKTEYLYGGNSNLRRYARDMKLDIQKYGKALNKRHQKKWAKSATNSFNKLINGTKENPGISMALHAGLQNKIKGLKPGFLNKWNIDNYQPKITRVLTNLKGPLAQFAPTPEEIRMNPSDMSETAQRWMKVWYLANDNPPSASLLARIHGGLKQRKGPRPEFSPEGNIITEPTSQVNVLSLPGERL